ncbi:MAG: fumarylacetoacetate hydrolase family protein [Planctomycetia bacterium]|nr:fumarylacetoacetate hydrolase family protein [Planctomycetia bacterium]
MKLQTYQASSEARVAIQTPQGLIDIQKAQPQLPSDIQTLLGMEGWLEKVQELRKQPGLPVIPVETVTLLPVIPHPEKIICVGLNYADHAAETGDQIPEIPVIFNKFPTAVAGQDAVVPIPRGVRKMDYEAELVVVMGKGGRNINRQEAWKHIAGFCCGNDLSARDWQFLPPARQWFIGKTFDGFAPIGPSLTTVDEIPQPAHLDISMKVNGECLQNSNTSQFIFDIPFLIEWISQVATLCPGDLIFTGTPPGVGMGKNPPRYLKEGDICEVEIEKIGILRTKIGKTR